MFCGAPQTLNLPETAMTKFNIFLTRAAVCGVAWVAAFGQNAAQSADLTAPLSYGRVPREPVFAYGGGFDPFLDPRCRIVPQPEASLYGETARFRPTAVCQSRGLYADSVVVP